MKWLKSLLNWSFRSRLPSWYPRTSPVSDIVLNERSALTLISVWAAVDYISSAVANLSFEVYRRFPDGSKIADPSHPAYDLIHFSPDGETTAFRFRQSQMVHVLTNGNSYSEIVRDGGGRPVRLNLLDPAAVVPFRS